MEILLQVLFGLLLAIPAMLAICWCFAIAHNARERINEQMESIRRDDTPWVWRAPHDEVTNWERVHRHLHDRKWEHWE